jgi:hypothetical protein
MITRRKGQYQGYEVKLRAMIVNPALIWLVWVGVYMGIWSGYQGL